eukprot:1852760-Rhodomonas_salina.1
MVLPRAQYQSDYDATSTGAMVLPSGPWRRKSVVPSALQTHSSSPGSTRYTHQYQHLYQANRPVSTCIGTT